MEHSIYQTEIFNVYKNTKKNIFVSAGPGSGKSFTILEMVKQTPLFRKVFLTAFNKAIADELKSRVPTGVDVSTIHSMGFKVFRKSHYGSIKVNEIKTFILAKKILANPFKCNEKKFYGYLFTIAKLYDLYRMNLTVKSEENLRMLADEYSVDILQDTIIADTLLVISSIEKYNNKPSKSFMVDFTDMLWLPYKKVEKTYFPKYDVVFIDEVQDLNPLQRELILNTIDNGRFVAVGDEKQAIYSFMGSNLASFEKLKTYPNTEVLPLSVSYRCGTNIINYANEVFPGIEAFENNPEGIISFGNFGDIKEGDFVICRNNLPLIETFLELLKQGKRSYIIGKEYGKELINIINSVENAEGLDNLLTQKAESLKERGVKNVRANKVFIALSEKIDIIKYLLASEKYTFDGVLTLFNAIFQDKNYEKDIITLSTIHKAKGLESDRIIWLYPQLLPSKYAETELELYQERCLKYVAITRAKKELIIINQKQ